MPSRSRPPSADEPRWLSEEEQRAWVGIGHLVVQLPNLLDAQLQRDAQLTMFEYFVLSRLSMAPDRRLRMSELSEVTGGSLSRLSNVVKRLEGRGYVVRRPDPSNRRYTNAFLTDPGWDKVVEAAPGHVDAVRRFVLEPLDAAQLDALADVGDRLRRRVAAECDGEDPAAR